MQKDESVTYQVEQKVILYFSFWEKYGSNIPSHDHSHLLQIEKSILQKKP
jgi:hypothetical protein